MPIATIPFLPDDIIIGAPKWGWPAIAGGIFIALIVLWNYLFRSRRSISAAVAASLKILAILLLAFCLVEPLRSGVRPRPKANIVGVVVDDSQSMTIRDGRRGKSFASALQPQLSEERGWYKRLSQSFDVRSYAFGSRLKRLSKFDELKFDAAASGLGEAIESIDARFARRPVAGVLVMSDGNGNDVARLQSLAEKTPFPLYPVVLEDFAAPADLRISHFTITETEFETAPVTLNITLTASGMDAGETVLRVTDLAEDSVVHEEEFVGPADGATKTLRVQLKPARPGVAFYRVDTFRASDRRRYDEGAVAGEATLENNRRFVAVNRGRGPYRVLYVAGRPNWEFKFLRRALDTDDEVRLVGLLRLAKKEPRFSFRDSSVSDTNRLFAGQGESEETAEQYDEPVLVRFGIEESSELDKGFPKSIETLYAYHAVVLDDLETDFFTQDQMMMLRAFVTDRGGTLLQLGGAESFSRESDVATPLADLSPVYYLPKQDQPLVDPLRYQLTREGLLQPWLRLRSTEEAEFRRREELPPLGEANPVGRAKPGATVLATITDGSGRVQPGMVVQRFGAGKTVAMPIADRWRWSMHRQPGDEDQSQSWRQIVRWLVSDVMRRIEVEVEQRDGPNQPANITVVLRDAAFRPLDNADVQLTLRRPDGTEAVLDADPDPDRAGVYTAAFQATQTGGYLVTADAVALDGSSIGTRSAGWASDPVSDEFQQMTPNLELLGQLAAKTGGELVPIDELDSFSADLPNRKVPVTESWIYPLWHRGWILALAIACLCGEWGIRRWKGMP